MPLAFLHLSDIHFRVEKGPVWDLDGDLRNELERDAKRVLDQLGISPASILVTGDIAFHGAEDEYNTAWQWLSDRLCPTLASPTENIRCVPGNHDVDWSCIERSRTIRDCYEKLQAVNVQNLDSEIQDYFQEPWVFYKKLDAYNRFAAKFDSDFHEHQPFWQSDYRLNDGSILRLRGLNSTLVSSELDDDGARRLILGQHQCLLPRADGVEYMILCHHPPRWLKDGDTAREILAARAKVLLFGHRHMQRFYPASNVIEVSAGAVHPSRREPEWQPRYNWLQVSTVQREHRRELEVRIYPRVWNAVRMEFGPDYQACNGDTFVLSAFPLDALTTAVDEPRRTEYTPLLPAVEPDQQANDSIASHLPIEAAVPSDPVWTLAHRYLSLPFVVRIRIAEKLNLLDNEDETLEQSDLFKNIFKRAKDRGMLANLWDAVMESGGRSPGGPNPFRVPKTEKDNDA